MKANIVLFYHFLMYKYWTFQLAFVSFRLIYSTAQQDATSRDLSTAMVLIVVLFRRLEICDGFTQKWTLTYVS